MTKAAWSEVLGLPTPPATTATAGTTETAAPASTSELLNARQSTHGDFRDNGAIMQDLKDRVRAGKNWSRLRPYQKEALDMIEHKVGRIMSGDPDVLDHWDDIAGYSQRVASILREDGVGK